ncbi:hypothetical protein [Nguyenibacter sp. L1]|uniref:hypothetical protein n=1 Tax=Nguyenibacter sp. L1 TaxID=3049350 RepID=UPI002B48CECC|nr:hypothetical protein [Nguyenibacter sp. L1]WRH89550.1 hypothetical protein QN315_08155 [Nguyenibacter sp. L1]
MGMNAPPPRHRVQHAAATAISPAGPSKSLLPKSLLLGTVLLGLAGCGHRDAFDATMDWWHQYEGGAIARQRPPPPGAHDPYPAVGLTPTTPPVVPSATLRQSVTENLVEQRNLAHRQGAEIGALTIATPPSPTSANPPPANARAGAPPAAPGTPPAARPAPPGVSSAMLAAAEAPPQPARPPAPHAASTAAPAGETGTGETGTGEPLLAMPEVGENVGGLGGKAPPPPAPLPAIPAAPPAPPQFPGFAVPSDIDLPTLPHPDYALADLAGTRIRFPAGNDQPQPGQDGTLHQLAGQAQGRPVYVHGYGEAASTDPAEQTRATTLALLRARAIADRLVADGVPAGTIRLRGHPFGDGARISFTQ